MVTGRSLCFRRFWAGGCFRAFSAMVSGTLNRDRDFCDLGGVGSLFGPARYGFSLLNGVFFRFWVDGILFLQPSRVSRGLATFSPGSQPELLAWQRKITSPDPETNANTAEKNPTDQRSQKSPPLILEILLPTAVISKSNIFASFD